jgi:hypothetical protein
LCLRGSSLTVLHQTKLGTIWGPSGAQMGTERSPRVRDRLRVWVQIALGGDQRSVTGDLPEHVDRDTGVGHPGKARVPQVMAAQMLIAELDDDLIPVGRVPQDSGGDPPAARTREDAGSGVMADRVEALFDERADFFDERDGTGSLSFGAFGDETTGAGGTTSPSSSAARRWIASSFSSSAIRLPSGAILDPGSILVVKGSLAEAVA